MIDDKEIRIRVSDEVIELNIKIDALVKFLINKPSISSCSDEQIMLLQIQLKHMKSYASCLNLRLVLYK